MRKSISSAVEAANISYSCIESSVIANFIYLLAQQNGGGSCSNLLQHNKYNVRRFLEHEYMIKLSSKQQILHI